MKPTDTRKALTHLVARGCSALAIVTLLSVAPGCEFLGLDGGEAQQAETADSAKKADEAKVAEDATPEPEPVKQAAAAEEYERPEYPEGTRRNPFQPDLEVIQPTNVATEGDERTLEPLERFSLGELTLVAIISEVAVPKAMFIDPEGFGHVLKEGDRIGENSGVLSDVRDNEVEITETTGEDEGKTRLRTMKLQSVEIRIGDTSGLTDEEREALDKLLQTEEGRDALQRQYRDMALGASAVNNGQQNQPQGGDQQGTAPPRQRDTRFPGIQPPSGNQ